MKCIPPCSLMTYSENRVKQGCTNLLGKFSAFLLFQIWLQFVLLFLFITKTCLFKYIENFTTKNWKFSDKNSDIFHISVQNIDCGYLYRGGSNKNPKSMFLSRNKKNNVYPCKPQFNYIKVGFKGVKIIWICFCDESYIAWIYLIFVIP